MIAAFLCGVLYGWLGYRAYVTAHNRRVLAETLPPSQAEAWDYVRYNANKDLCPEPTGEYVNPWPHCADLTRVTIDGRPYYEWLHRMRSEGSSVA